MPDFDEAEVIEKIFQNIGANPPGGVVAQARALGRIEFRNGFHQADVAFLDQVQDVGVHRAVFHRDFDDEPQIGLNEGLGGLDVAFFA